MVGQTLAHYKILEKIGSGGMGDVYLAEDTKLDRKVALKVLPPGLAENEERRARFKREAKAIAALNHPNIVTVYSVEEAAGVHFITMEMVRGKTLSELLPERGFSLAKLLALAIPLADAVSTAHDQGIIHRDLKPDNVMENEEGRIKNPHIHAIVTRGVFLTNGQWHPIPYVDPHKAELVFRHKLLRLLRDRDLISEERIDLLLSWRQPVDGWPPGYKRLPATFATKGFRATASDRRATSRAVPRDSARTATRSAFSLASSTASSASSGTSSPRSLRRSNQLWAFAVRHSKLLQCSEVAGAQGWLGWVHSWYKSPFAAPINLCEREI